MPGHDVRDGVPDAMEVVAAVALLAARAQLERAGAHVLEDDRR